MTIGKKNYNKELKERRSIIQLSLVLMIIILYEIVYVYKSF